MIKGWINKKIWLLKGISLIYIHKNITIGESIYSNKHYRYLITKHSILSFNNIVSIIFNNNWYKTNHSTWNAYNSKKY